MRYVVTGANRGIGLEFVRQLLAKGHTVDATARSPEAAGELRSLQGALRVHACDVADGASVRKFADHVKGPVDVLVNNAGTMGEMSSFAELSFEDALETFNVNALGALRVTQALLPRILESKTRKVASITSGMGSISDNGSGGAYGYRMSKAALNMGNRSLAVDHGDQGLIAVVFNPGWVQTDMGGSGAPTAVDESVRKLLGLIDGLTLEHSGQFLDYRGHVYAW